MCVRVSVCLRECVCVSASALASVRVLDGLTVGFDALKASGVQWGMRGRLDAVRRDVGEDLVEPDYPTIFGESASWNSDHS